MQDSNDQSENVYPTVNTVSDDNPLELVSQDDVPSFTKSEENGCNDLAINEPFKNKTINISTSSSLKIAADSANSPATSESNIPKTPQVDHLHISIKLYFLKAVDQDIDTLDAE